MRRLDIPMGSLSSQHKYRTLICRPATRGFGGFVKPRVSGYFNGNRDVPAFLMTTLDVDMCLPSATKEARTNTKKLLVPIAWS
jgi:hypothetical protein